MDHFSKVVANRLGLIQNTIIIVFASPFKIVQKHCFQFYLESTVISRIIMTYFKCLEKYSLYCNHIEVPLPVTWLRLNYHETSVNLSWAHLG